MLPNKFVVKQSLLQRPTLQTLALVHETSPLKHFCNFAKLLLLLFHVEGQDEHFSEADCMLGCSCIEPNPETLRELCQAQPWLVELAGECKMLNSYVICVAICK